ncbi:hypothetical protein [Nocardia amamiensis]|uniref:hypothetical protein n=1 Tax=Nocardia TaxID=1817 RepID=UPI0033D802FD
MPELTYLSDFPVNTDMTEFKAQDRSVEHLTETLRVLPQELSLDAREEWFGTRMDYRHVFSCMFDESVVDAPYRLMIDYLVVGGTRPPDDYLPAFESGWGSLGWTIDHPTASGTVIEATTPDHFSLTVAVATTGDTAITVASPCFPSTNRGGAGPLPESIPHP